MPSFLVDHRFRAPRLWSNQVLRQIGPHLAGDVVNVSGWLDEDKEGGHYRDYFPAASRYDVSNYGGYRGEGEQGELRLDLEADLPPPLAGAYDVVFNHTTLEHVFDVFAATRNLCAMSRDVVILVVPYIQEQHTAADFSDYWRFTPLGLQALLTRNGFEVVLFGSNAGKGDAVYHLCVASRNPEKWKTRLAGISASANDGKAFFDRPIRENLARLARRLVKAGQD